MKLPNEGDRSFSRKILRDRTRMDRTSIPVVTTNVTFSIDGVPFLSSVNGLIKMIGKMIGDSDRRPDSE